MKCEHCGCPFSTTIGYRTADAYTAWQDIDGKWYKGPAEETSVMTCDGCGKTTKVIKRRGKVVEDQS